MSFGHPSGEVVDEGAYIYTAPSSTPSYLWQTCRSVRSTGRWPVGTVAQPGAHFFAGDSKKIWRGVSFIFAFRENKLLVVVINRGRGRYRYRFSPIGYARHVGLRRVASTDTSGSIGVSSLAPCGRGRGEGLGETRLGDGPAERTGLFSRDAKIIGVAIGGWPKTAIRPNRAPGKLADPSAQPAGGRLAPSPNRVPIFLLGTAKKYGEAFLLFSRFAKISRK